jgi:hypothetical protein
VDIRVQQLIIQLAGCDSDSSDVPSEPEQDATDELSGTEELYFWSFSQMSHPEWWVYVFL